MTISNNFCVGLEFELEDVYCPPRVEGWAVHEDDTLRGDGIEYVLRSKQPTWLARDLVQELLVALGNKFTVSQRCSSHIHIDISDLTSKQYIDLYLGLAMTDNWFFKYGAGRKANNFCCPTYQSPSILSALEMLYLRSGVAINRLGHDDLKYLSVNPMPANTQGSIELRHFAPLMDYADFNAVLTRIESIYTAVTDDSLGLQHYAQESGLLPEYEWAVTANSVYRTIQNLGTRTIQPAAPTLPTDTLRGLYDETRSSVLTDLFGPPPTPGE